MRHYPDHFIMISLQYEAESIFQRGINMYVLLLTECFYHLAPSSFICQSAIRNSSFSRKPLSHQGRASENTPYYTTKNFKLVSIDSDISASLFWRGFGTIDIIRQISLDFTWRISQHVPSRWEKERWPELAQSLYQIYITKWDKELQ